MKKTVITLILCLLIAGSANGFDENPAGEIRGAQLIKPGDTLRINVWKYSDLSMTLTVGTDGHISYSHLGSLLVAGKTVEDVRREITAKLDEQYIANPQVDVQLESLPLTIFVVGEVVKPGSYSYQSGLDPLKIVAMAGGFTDFASRSALIVRKDSEGKEIQIKANLRKLMKANSARDKYQLLPGDMVVVKRSWF